MSNLSRRQLAILPGLAWLAPAVAEGQTSILRGPPKWTEQPAFTTGRLAADPIGRQFRAPAADLVWPAAPLIGRSGPKTLADWRGKTLLVALWAEWCAPCLAELPALARLNHRYGSQTFEILPVLTGSETIHSFEEAIKKLASIRGADIGTVVDGGPGGRTLMNVLALAASDVQPSAAMIEAMKKASPNFVIPADGKISSSMTRLPCLVLVDPRGVVRGRSFGLVQKGPRSAWETGQGEAFVKALARGALA